RSGFTMLSGSPGSSKHNTRFSGMRWPVSFRPFLERTKIQPVYVKSIGVRSGAKYLNYRIAGKSWLRPQALSYCIALSLGVWHERIHLGYSETFRTTR